MKLVKNCIRDSENIHVFECTSCNNQQLNPLPSIDETQEFYDENRQAKSVYYDNINIDTLMKKSYADINRRFTFLEKYIQDKTEAKILEIGCGYGFL